MWFSTERILASAVHDFKSKLKNRTMGIYGGQTNEIRRQFKNNLGNDFSLMSFNVNKELNDNKWETSLVSTYF